jgi:predicted exporter
MALVLCGGLLASKGRIDSGLTLFLPRAAQPLDRIFLNQLQEGPTSRLILIRIEGGTEGELASLNKRFAAALGKSERFSSVINGNTGLTQKDRRFLFRYRYLLSPGVHPDRFTTDGLRGALEERLRRLTSPAGMFEKQFLGSDPTGEFLRILESLSKVGAPAKRKGVWFSPDGSRTLLMVRTQSPAFELDAQEKNLTTLHQTFRKVAGDRPFRLEVTGPPVFAVKTRKIIQQEAWLLSLIALTLTTTFLWWAYRSFLILALLAVPLVSGVIVATTVVTMVFGAIHGITLSFGITLVGVAIDYPIHALTPGGKNENLKGHLERIWPTLRLGVLSTCLGYLAILVTSFAGLTQLGLFAITGLSIAAAVTHWILPTLASGSSSPRIFDLPGERLERITDSLGRLGPLPAFCLAGGLLFLTLWPHPFWDNDLSRLSPISTAEKQQDRRIRQELGAPEVRKLVVVLAQSAEGALSQSERLLPVLNDLVRQDRLKGFDMAALHLPSMGTQRLRQKTLPEPNVLNRNLETALNGLPFAEGVFSSFQKAVQASRDLEPVRPDTLGAGVLKLWVDPLLFQSQGRWVALVLLRGADTLESLPPIAGSTDEGTVHLIDLKEWSEQLVGSYRKEALLWVGFGVVLLVLTLFLGLRSWKAVARVILPVLAAVVTTASLLVFLEDGITLALFFQRHFDRGQERQRTARAVLACCFTTLLTFSVLAFSRSDVLHAIGMTVSLGVLFSLLFGVMLTNSQIRSVKPTPGP